MPCQPGEGGIAPAANRWGPGEGLDHRAPCWWGAGFAAGSPESWCGADVALPGYRGWTKIKNPGYWRRESEIAHMQRSRERLAAGLKGD